MESIQPPPDEQDAERERADDSLVEKRARNAMARKAAKVRETRGS